MTANEFKFVNKVRNALDDSLDNLPLATSDRLAAARKLALARKKAAAPLRAVAPRHVLAGLGGGFFQEPVSWLGRMGMMLPLVVLVGGLIGLYVDERQQRIDDLAEIDALVLTDELPLTAYLDHGFNAYLSKRGE